MQRIGNYEVVGELARGGMGVVFRGRDLRDGREVAIKVQLQLGGSDLRTRRANRRFRTESMVLQRLRHPNVVPVLDAGEDPRGNYLVMELVHGETIAEIIEDGPLDSRRAARIALALAEGLHCVHRNGVLHRDVKPANVLITSKGVPRLTDFGLAKDLDATLAGASVATQEGGFIGSAGYLPPEQAHGQLDRIGPVSDIYGVGATLYAMLTGVPPHAGDSLIEVVAAMSVPPAEPRTLRPGLDAELSRLCMRCLAREPDDRPASARALANALEAYLQGRGTAASPPKVFPAAVGAALALLAVGAIALALTRGPSDAPSDVATEVPPSAVVEVPPPSQPPPVPPPSQPPPVVAAPSPSPPPIVVDERPSEEPRAMTSEEYGASAEPDANDWFKRGLTLEAQGGAADAIRAYTRALEVDPSYNPARFNRGLLLYRAEDASAVADFELVAGAAADWLPAWQMLGLALSREGRASEAIWAFDRAIQLAPESAMLLANRAGARLESQPKEARADLEAALALDPDYAPAYYERALLREGEGDTDGALEDYGRAVEIDPTLTSAFANRGVLRDNLKDHEGALADYDRALEFAPDDAVLHANRGIAQRKAGDVERAILDFTRAIELDPDHVDAWTARGQARAANKEWKGAETDFAKALTFLPDHPSLYFNRGVMRTRTKNPAGARKDFERTLTLVPKDDRLAKKARGMLANLDAEGN